MFVGVCSGCRGRAGAATNLRHHSSFWTAASSESNNNDAAAAEADFNKAIELDLRNVMAFRWQAVARQTLGNNQGAEEDLTLAIRLNPYDHNVFYERATLRRKLNFTAGAGQYHQSDRTGADRTA